jgi:hypothetical protein
MCRNAQPTPQSVARPYTPGDLYNIISGWQTRGKVWACEGQRRIAAFCLSILASSAIQFNKAGNYMTHHAIICIVEKPLERLEPLEGEVPGEYILSP